MKYQINNQKKDLIIVPIISKDNECTFCTKVPCSKNLLEHAKQLHFKGKQNETLYTVFENQKYLLIGLNNNFTLEDIRNAYGTASHYIQDKEETDIGIYAPSLKKNEIKAMIEGFDLAHYSFNKYKTDKKEQKNISISLYIDERYKKLLEEILIITEQVKFTRDIVTENSNVITPEKLEGISKAFAKKHSLKIKVLNEKQIVKEGLHLLDAVGKGSDFPPRLIIVEYKGNPTSKETIALVGKGITFDTGGTNLKPTGYLETMRTDMGGAGTVLGAFKAAVQLQLKKNLLLVIPAAENSLSSKSYKPGDIYYSHKGLSVEIGNTDAEGRLVLADAISYVQNHYRVTQIIDVATLTGACLVALGPSLIAMCGNDTKAKQTMFLAGEETFERVWELPIYDEHRELIKSQIADIKNIGGKYGGTITAAAFLEKFIKENISWIHLDIAGAARAEKPTPYIPSEGTGRGVRLLLEYLQQLQ
jgi:leucyl aminopeptidase